MKRERWISIRFTGLLAALAVSTSISATHAGAPRNRFVQFGTPNDVVNDLYYDVSTKSAYLVGEFVRDENQGGNIVDERAKLYTLGPDGLASEFVFPDTTFGQAISPDGQYIAVTTEIFKDRWDSQVYQRSNLAQPWRNLADIQLFDVANNGDAVGDRVSTATPLLADADEGIMSLPSPSGHLMAGRLFAISADSSMIFGSTSRQNDFVALATKWNDLSPAVLPHDHAESGFVTAASPSGRYLTGIDFADFRPDDGLVFETSSIPIWHDDELLGYMHGEIDEPLRGIDKGDIEFSGGTGITDSGLAVMNTYFGPHVWWPTLSVDRPELNLGPLQAVPFTTAFEDLIVEGSRITGASAVFADQDGLVHFALDSVDETGSFAPAYASALDPAFRMRLQAGDADQDLKFDPIDLVRVQVAAKYLSGAVATWGEGDWDGAPGGSPGNPPRGDGFFNQFDILAALSANHYLSGPYAAVRSGGEARDEQTSIGYNAATGEIWIEAPASSMLTAVNIDSASAIFSGDPATNLGGSFDNDAEENLFKAVFGSAFGSLSFGNIAPPGLAEEFLQSDLTVVGSLASGGGLGEVDLIYVAEPSALVLLILGTFAVIGLGNAREMFSP